jgi:hypothetical protein
VGSFWWKDVISLFPKFESLATCKPNKGDSVAFWSKEWRGQDQAFKDLYPHLYSFTRKPKCSLLYYMEQDVKMIFSPMPLPQQAAAQLEDIDFCIQQANFEEEINDTWSYSWGTSVQEQ